VNRLAQLRKEKKNGRSTRERVRWFLGRIQFPKGADEFAKEMIEIDQKVADDPPDLEGIIRAAWLILCEVDDSEPIGEQLGFALCVGVAIGLRLVK
jgi:hypothetical protein